MPPLLLLALGVGLCGVELCVVAGADDDGVLLAGGLLVPDEPPQAVTSATSAAGMIIRRRFVITNLLRWLEGSLLDVHGPYSRPVHRQSFNGSD
jgi:hypothetical protein